MKQKQLEFNKTPRVYKCDPKKNKNCKKTACQILCFYSLNPANSADGKVYKYNANTGKEEVVDS